MNFSIINNMESTAVNYYPLKSIIVLFIAFNGFFLASLITIGQLLVDRKSPKARLFFLLFFILAQMSILGGFGTLFFIFYLCLALRLLLNSYMLSRRVTAENPEVLVAFCLLLFLMFALICDVAAISFNSKVFMEVSLLMLNLIIISFFLIVFKYPDYYKIIHLERR